jgi:hypothetical protein
MQNLDAVAFLALGLAIAAAWLRNRDASLSPTHEEAGAARQDCSLKVAR